MNRSDARKGMKVTATNGTRYPGTGVIDKVNPKSIDVTLDTGQKVRFDPMYLVPEGAEPNPLEEAVGRIGNPNAEVVPYVPAPQPGTVVRVSAKMIGRYGQQLAGLWIVTGGQNDKSRLFRLNNVDGRYWRIPNSELTKVNAVVTEVQP